MYVVAHTVATSNVRCCKWLISTADRSNLDIIFMMLFIIESNFLFRCLVDQLRISSMKYTKTNQENSKTLKKHQNIEMSVASSFWKWESIGISSQAERAKKRPPLFLKITSVNESLYFRRSLLFHNPFTCVVPFASVWPLYTCIGSFTTICVLFPREAPRLGGSGWSAQALGKKRKERKGRGEDTPGINSWLQS